MCIVVPRISFIYPGHFQVLKRCCKLSIEENVTGPAIKIFPFLPFVVDTFRRWPWILAKSCWCPILTPLFVPLKYIFLHDSTILLFRVETNLRNHQRYLRCTSIQTVLVPPRKWLRGMGSVFSIDQINRNFNYHVGKLDLKALLKFWLTFYFSNLEKL